MTSGTEARSRPLGRGGVRAHAERASSVDRFAARARARRRAPWRRVLIGLLAAAIMAGVVWLRGRERDGALQVVLHAAIGPDQL